MELMIADVYNAYEAAGRLLDEEAPVALSFKIADLVIRLEGQRKAAQLVIDKIPKDEHGNPEKTQLYSLLSQKVEIDPPRITRSELTDGFTTITPRTIMALMPFLEVESDG